jgi:hypothetical protein
MKKKILILSGAIFTVVVLVIFFLGNSKQTEPMLTTSLPTKEKIKIAACPTCYEADKKLDKEKYEIVPTATTAESATLLARGSVDMLLAGRTLKPSEAAADFLVLTGGYSFLGDKQLNLDINEIKDRTIFTDLDPVELKNNLPDFTFKQVDDVYDYITKGIVLTTWENTDYSRAEIVHVYENNGRRLAMSRRPTLYCPTNCQDEVATDIKAIFD